MKKGLPIAVAILSGLFVLAGLIFQPYLGPYLGLVLNWAVIVGSMALLVAIASLIISHARSILTGRKGFIFSIVILASFGLSLVGGLWLGVDNPAYLKWVGAIQRPLEVSLLGLVALIMTSAAVQVFRNRGWSPLTVSFGLSAIFFLLIALGLLQTLEVPQIATVIGYIRQLPLVGARGLLIGVAIGAVMMAIRVLLGSERPYSD